MSDVVRPDRCDERQIMARRATVSQYYLSNMTVREIAKVTNVSSATVQKDIEAIRAEWRKECFVNIDAVLQRELMKLDRMERDAHLLMARLMQPAEPDPETGQRTVYSGPVVENGLYCLKLMERRAKLLGLDRPERASRALAEVEVDDEPEAMADVYRLLDRLALTSGAAGGVVESAEGEAAEPPV